jgi:hypothetical protein
MKPRYSDAASEEFSGLLVVEFFGKLKQCGVRVGAFFGSVLDFCLDHSIGNVADRRFES